MVRSKQKELERNDLAARLLDNADFKEWWQELVLLARMEGLNSLSPNRSNFDRAMCSGTLDFIERRQRAMELQSRPEARKKLRESLEESKDDRSERSAGKHEPTGFAGISAIGEF